MTIDMGESLILSYLKHIKKCKIVQTNWKVSDSWDKDEAKDIILANLKNSINGIDESIFGKEEISKIIKQAECDAIGITFDEANSPIIYAVDVAFHRDGLGYGSEKVNAIKVVHKSVRTAMLIYKFFHIDKAEIIFATPKVKGRQYELIQEYILQEDQIVKNHLGPRFSIKFIYGDEFKTEILGNVHSLYNSVNDTSECFLRCYQLLKLFDGDMVKAFDEDIESQTPENAEVNVGWIANNTLREKLESITNLTTIKELTTEEYSKNHFLLHYPVIAGCVTNEHKNRYYMRPLKILGAEYYLCNDWYERNRQPLLKWIENFTKIQNGEEK